MIGHWCNCGFHARTLATLRAHAKKCDQASVWLRAAEDRARLDRVDRAKKINDVARADAWRQLHQSLEKP